jgi:hypothetical protein
MNLFISSFAIPDPGADNKQLYLWRAPTDSLGGGVRLLSAYATQATSMNAGTSFSYQLLKYSSAGTPAVNGTISSAIGGTAATVWTAGVPQAFTVSSSYNFFDAGEWLVVDYQEDTAGNPTGSYITCVFQMGY